MTKAKTIEALAKEFERVDTKCYQWSDELFDVWWYKDPRAEYNRKKQRARAKVAIEFLEKNKA